MIDDDQLKARARALLLAGPTAEADAIAEAETRKAASNQVDEAVAGMRIEYDAAIQKHQTVGTQRARRAIDARRSKEAHVEKFFVGSSRTSIDDAVSIYMRASAEDDFLAA